MRGTVIPWRESGPVPSPPCWRRKVTDAALSVYVVVKADATEEEQQSEEAACERYSTRLSSLSSDGAAVTAFYETCDTSLTGLHALAVPYVTCYAVRPAGKSDRSGVEENGVAAGDRSSHATIAAQNRHCVFGI